VGACRMCLVEIEGARGLQTSCTTPVRDGMVVKVHDSEAAVKARRANLEFLLTNHPLDCPVCDKGGECPLQDQAMLDGPGASRYVEEKRHKNKRYPLGELIVLDQERCVLCWRCIRFLDEWAGDHELDLFGRGADTCLDTFPGRPLTSKWQGNTIDVCPVGALTSREFRFEARVWELTNIPSVCPMCPVGCNIILGVKNNVLRRITPRENPQVNDAWICDKGRFTQGYVDHADRLKEPLIRREGILRPATWDEALSLIAERFAAILQQKGPQAIAGLGSTRATNESNYLFQRFFRSVVGTNSVDHQRRLPDGAATLSSLPDLEHKDAILLLGFDPSAEAPLVELWIKKAVLRRGAQVVAVHPERIELARLGGTWLGYRPGTETALLSGLARAILDAGLVMQAARGTNLEDYRGWLRDETPQKTERLTGVKAEALQQAGKVLAQARHPIILYGPDCLHGAVAGAAAAIQAAIANLSLLLGGAEAAYIPEDNNTLGALEMGVVPGFYPGRQPFTDQVRSRLAGFFGGKLSPVPGLDFDGMMAGTQDGSLQAIWIMGADPVNDCRTAGAALGRIPFLVVQDLFMTDTAQLAEVVLPAASFAETDGSFINLTGRLQVVHAAKRPPGQARPDWWIIAELARRMVDAKRRKAWEPNGAAGILDEISKVVPGYRGIDRGAVGELGWQPPAQPSLAKRSFVRVPPAEGYSFLSPAEEYPLILFASRLLYDRGTLLRRSGRVGRLVPKPFVLIHPSDADRLGLCDRDEVSVVSVEGRLDFVLRVGDEAAPGVAVAPRDLSAVPLSVLYTDCRTLPRVRIIK